jgi:hypothetical protein
MLSMDVCRKCYQVYDKIWISQLEDYWDKGEAQCIMLSTRDKQYLLGWFHLKDGPPPSCPYKMEHGVAGVMNDM